MCDISKQPKYKIGLEIQPICPIKLHVKDFSIRLGIQHSLGNIGTVVNNQFVSTLIVKKLEKVIKVIPFFAFRPALGSGLGLRQKYSLINLAFFKESWAAVP